LYHLIDADRHVTEPFSLWPEYVDKDIYSKTPVYLIEKTAEKDGKSISYSQAMIADFPVIMNWSFAIQWAASTLEKDGKTERYASMHPASQLQSMDVSGVDKAFLFPAFTMNIVNHSEISSEVSLAYATAYNRWLNDYIAVAPQRLKGVGVISRHEPASMVQQLEKIIALGWTSITLRPEVIKGRALGHEDYHPFYAACANNNIAIIFHGGTHLHGSTVGSERFTSRFGLHACSHPMELQMAFVSLLDSGVLEQNPTLKIGLLEGGCSWVPHWLWRLDNICYPEFPSLVKDTIKKLPSAYFKQHCWVAIEPNEPCIAEVIRYIGHEKLIFGTDFPHPDHLGFDLEKDFNAHPELSVAMLKDIFEKNPIDLFEAPYAEAI
jgi:uncharacterized protein